MALIFFIWLNTVTMKKLLTLVVLVAGVALFAGCMNKPVVEDEITTPVVEETIPVVEETTPVVEENTGTTTTEEPEVIAE